MRFSLGTCAVGLLFIIPSAVGQSEGPSEHQDVIWFVGTGSAESPGKLWLEPLATVDRDGLHEAPTSCIPEAPEYRNLAAKYLKAGDQYVAVSRGAPAGTAVVEEVPDNTIGGNARYEGPLAFGELTPVLVTNAAPPKRVAPPSQPLSARQQEKGLRLAKTLFLQAGVPQSLVALTKVRKSEAIMLSPEAAPKLVASFWIDRLDESGISHNLFLVAHAQRSHYVPELVVLKISESETDNQQTDLVDHADLLGTGDQELVTETTYYENYRYTIHQRQGTTGKWKVILETEILGCE